MRHKTIALFLALCALCRGFAGNLEASGGGGILLYRDDGQIVFWNSGASYKNNSGFENALSLYGIGSSLPGLSASVSGVGYSAKLGLKSATPKITAGLMVSSDIRGRWGARTRVQNDGAVGFYIGAAPSFNVGDIEITPSVFYAGAKFGDGDFYYFYGSPDIPGITRAGVYAEYGGRHGAGFNISKFDINLVNEGRGLFSSGNSGADAHYAFILADPQKPWKFTARAGFAYAELSVDGSLSAANQQYALFPYLFYNVYGEADALAGWAAASFDRRGKYLDHKLKAGAANILGGNAHAVRHYQNRKFFGDEEEVEIVAEINLAGTGAAFAAYTMEGRGWAIGENIGIRWEAQKVLGYYWGMKKFTALYKPEAPPKPGPADSWETARTVLLSGLSANLRVQF